MGFSPEALHHFDRNVASAIYNCGMEYGDLSPDGHIEVDALAALNEGLWLRRSMEHARLLDDPNAHSVTAFLKQKRMYKGQPVALAEEQKKMTQRNEHKE